MYHKDARAVMVTIDSLLEIARENMVNASFIHKFGLNSDIDQVPEDIWDGGGDGNANNIYDWVASAETLYISSSDVSDVVDINVLGLDGNWAEQNQIQTLAGQDKTEIGSSLSWWRTFRAYNEGATPLAGTVYIYADCTVTAGVPQTPGNIRAIITQGEDQTLMAIYTIPAGHTGYILDWYGTLAGKKSMYSDITLKIKEFGKTFRTRCKLELASTGSSYAFHPFPFPMEVPEKSDIRVMSDSSADNAAAAAGFDVLLLNTEAL